MKAILRLQEFEARIVPAAAIDSNYEAYAWVLINTLRRDPTTFANNLEGLVNGTVSSAFGFSKDDPVVTDLKNMLDRGNLQNYAASLSLMRSTAAAGPVGWEETLENRADSHNDWMRTNGLGHTGSTGTRIQIPGYSLNNSAAPDTWGYSGQYSAWGENIGYDVGNLRQSRIALNNNQITAGQFNQRAAFINTVSYMTEVYSSSLGHLKNLLGRDSGTSSTLPSVNAIGLDIDLYQAPTPYGDSAVSTHRTALYRPGGAGGFVAGIVYVDSNGNGYYDVGEGVAANIDVRTSSNVGFTSTLDAGKFGVFSDYTANGTYTVTATVNGQVVGTRTLTINNNNGWADFRLTSDLVDTKPTITGPNGTANQIRPTITWNTVPNAVTYQVRVDNLTTKTNNIFGLQTVSTTNWVPPSDLVSGQQYRVYVRMYLPGSIGPWSEAHSFTVGKPTLTGPLGTITNLYPQIQWTAITGATRYQIRLDNLTSKVNNVFSSQYTTELTWSPPKDLVSGHNYRWYVRALNGKNLGDWAPGGTFTVAKPTLTGPTGTINDLRPDFTWTSILNAKGYRIRIDNLSSGQVNIFPGQTTNNTHWELPRDLASGRTYRWWVKALNDRGVGVWSLAGTFKVGTPTLGSLSGEITSVRPTFTWSSVSDSEGYVIRVDDLTTGKQNVILSPLVTSTSWTPTKDLVVGHKYRWYVKAVNDQGLASWSLFNDFKVVS